MLVYQRVPTILCTKSQAAETTNIPTSITSIYFRTHSNADKWGWFEETSYGKLKKKHGFWPSNRVVQGSPWRMWSSAETWLPQRFMWIDPEDRVLKILQAFDELQPQASPPFGGYKATNHLTNFGRSSSKTIHTCLVVLERMLKLKSYPV